MDTDVFSFLMNGSGYAALYHPHVQGTLIAVSFIRVGELYFGAKKKGWGSAKIADLKSPPQDCNYRPVRRQRMCDVRRD